MARFFTPPNQYLDLTTAVVSSYPLTLACFFRYSSLDANQVIFSIGDRGVPTPSVDRPHWALNIDNVGQLYARTYNLWPNLADATVAVGLVADTWYHACGLFPSSNSRTAFLNGGNKTTDNTNIPFTYPVNTTTIANMPTQPGAGWDFHGAVAEAVAYNAILTDDEVAALASGACPLAVRPQNIAAYWPLWDTSDLDLVGGYDMTPIGGPTEMAHPPVFYSFPEPRYSLGEAGGPLPSEATAQMWPRMF